MVPCLVHSKGHWQDVGPIDCWAGDVPSPHALALAMGQLTTMRRVYLAEQERLQAEWNQDVCGLGRGSTSVGGSRDSPGAILEAACHTDSCSQYLQSSREHDPLMPARTSAQRPFNPSKSEPIPDTPSPVALCFLSAMLWALWLDQVTPSQSGLALLCLSYRISHFDHQSKMQAVSSSTMKAV